MRAKPSYFLVALAALGGRRAGFRAGEALDRVVELADALVPAAGHHLVDVAFCGDREHLDPVRLVRVGEWPVVGRPLPGRAGLRLQPNQR